MRPADAVTFLDPAQRYAGLPLLPGVQDARTNIYERVVEAYEAEPFLPLPAYHRILAQLGALWVGYSVERPAFFVDAWALVFLGAYADWRVPQLEVVRG